MAQSPEYPDLLWMPPKSFTRGRRPGQPTKIVVHYTAGAEGFGNVDINGAHYCQIRTDGTSAHYFVDGDSVTQCIKTTDESHTALLHGNDDGIHYELCGTVQTRAQWLDPVSRATIRLAARQMARDCRKHGILPRRLVGAQVRDRAATGICGHVDMTMGWPEDGGTHTDPGPQFPWDVLLNDIKAELEGDDDMAFDDEAKAWLKEVHSLLRFGTRPSGAQTEAGGVPIAWLPKAFHKLGVDLEEIASEVDQVEELAAANSDPVAMASAIAAQLGPAQTEALHAALGKLRFTVDE